MIIFLAHESLERLLGIDLSREVWKVIENERLDLGESDFALLVGNGAHLHRLLSVRVYLDFRRLQKLEERGVFWVVAHAESLGGLHIFVIAVKGVPHTIVLHFFHERVHDLLVHLL